MSFRLSKIATVGAALLTSVGSAAIAGPVAELKLGSEEIVGGVEVACTGVGQTKLDPSHLSYPVRVEFANARNEYLTDGEVAVTDAKQRPVVTVRCEGPWILLKLKPGAYRIEGHLANVPARPQGATFRSPSSGQMRLVLKFPDVDAGQSDLRQ